MNSYTRFLKACNNEKLERPPLWLMRQAGRYLPEYRHLKEKYSFLEMVKTPDLATEVSLQPLKRFPIDAVILFSDILVIPEALGMNYSFREEGGIAMEWQIKNKNDIENLSANAIEEKLNYVSLALKQIHFEVGNDKALIGFGGSPWTIASYMIEGGSSKNYAKIKTMLYEEPELFDLLLQKITRALVSYFKMQIRAGADVIQIFDSWGGVLSHSSFHFASARYMADIISSLKMEFPETPVIVFSKGSHHWLEDLKSTGADVLGFDWTTSLALQYDSLGGKTAVQGNLDPVLMNTSPEIVSQEAKKILDDFSPRAGHIFNLGHGILPQAKIECVDALCDTICNYGNK